MLTKARRERILASVDTLGELLKAWQKAMRYTDSEAARHCDLTPQHWWKLLRDERSDLRDATLYKLSHGTGYDLTVVLAAASRTRAKRVESRMADPEAVGVTG